MAGIKLSPIAVGPHVCMVIPSGRTGPPSAGRKTAVLFEQVMLGVWFSLHAKGICLSERSYSLKHHCLPLCMGKGGRSGTRAADHGRHFVDIAPSALRNVDRIPFFMAEELV